MKTWIVIEVKRGFIQEPEIFYKKAKAKRRMRELKRDYNPDYDELEMFEKQMKLLKVV